MSGHNSLHYMSTGTPQDERLREYVCILIPDDECQELSETDRHLLNSSHILRNGDRSDEQGSSTLQRHCVVTMSAILCPRR